MKQVVYDSVLAQWEKLTGKRAISRRAKTECYACYHESRAAVILSKLNREKMPKETRISAF